MENRISIFAEQLNKRIDAVVLSSALKAVKKVNRAVFDGIIKRRFTGKGPFPAAQHRLGVVSGRLRKSLEITEPKLKGRTISFNAGGTVSYFDIHEFGFSGTVRVSRHIRKGRKSRRKFSFGGRTVTRKVRGQDGEVRAHDRDVNFPARAPLTTGWEEKQTADIYTREISRTAEKDILAEMEKLAKGQ